MTRSYHPLKIAHGIFIDWRRRGGRVTERDIWATAKLMLKRFGDAAPIECAMRVDELSDEGDYTGAAIWKRVKVSVELLASNVPVATVH